MNKIKIIMEIIELKRDKRKKTRRFYLLNNFKCINGKKEQERIVINKEELPNTEETKNLWENLYKPNIGIDFNNEEIKEMLNKYDNIQPHKDENIREDEIINSIKSVPNWKAA